MNERIMFTVFQMMCTRQRVIGVWLCTALTLAAINAHFFATVTYPYVPYLPDVKPSSEEANTTVVEVAPMPICYVLLAHDCLSCFSQGHFNVTFEISTHKVKFKVTVQS